MRPLPARRLGLIPMLLLALAACDDDPSGPTDGLARGEVGGVYSMCILRFQATGLRPVDVLAAATEPSRAPELRLSLQRDDFDFEYTPKDDVVRILVQGAYQRGADGVDLNFPNEARISTLLLPDPLRLDYSDGRLSAAPSAEYPVPKADYVALAGLSAEEARNLGDPIVGTLTARFVRGDCA